jgi:hypothetical protein
MVLSISNRVMLPAAPLPLPTTKTTTTATANNTPSDTFARKQCGAPKQTPAPEELLPMTTLSRRELLRPPLLIATYIEAFPFRARTEKLIDC